MNAFKRICALAVSAALAASCLTGCGSSGSASSSADTSKPDASAPSTSAPVETIDLSTVTDPFLTTAGIKGDTVVATVGELEITAGELLYWAAYGGDSLSQYYNYYGLTQMPWDTLAEDGSTLAETLKKDALNTAAIYAALPTMAQEEGLELSQEFIDYVASGLENMSTALGGEEVANYFFWQYPLNTEMYTAMCESEEYSAMLVDHLYGENGTLAPTDAEILAYAEDELNLYSVKHILLAAMDTTTREPLDEKTVAEKKATAEDLVAQLQASSDPIALFEQLMHEYSEDPGLAGYPDGYLEVRPGQMVPEFEEASLALEVGQISGVVEAEGTGFHIILRLPLEIDTANYREAYVSEKMSARQEKWLADQTITTNEAFDQIDAGAFYDTLLVLRETIDAKLAEITADMEAEAGAETGTEADSSASSSAQK